MPKTPKGSKSANKSSTTTQKTPSKVKTSENNKQRAPNRSKAKLTELSQNTSGSQETSNLVNTNANMYGSIDGETTLRITIEKLAQLKRDGVDPKLYIANNLDGPDGYLELVGWSKGKHIPNTLYDSLVGTDLKIRRLALRGRGIWSTCYCPKERSKFGEQIDPSKENTTHLENLYIFRTFSISPCSLLNLIARSPKLKELRFYGDLEKVDCDHLSVFEAVRFLSNLERLYWPLCNKRYHLPTLRLIVSRCDQIATFYCNAERTCDFIGAEKLPNLRYLSLNLNEDWNYRLPDDATFNSISHNDTLSAEEKELKLTKKREKKCRKLMKSLPNRIEKLAYLTQLDKVEALELRTYEITFQDDEDDAAKNEQIIDYYETYQLKFWESVAKMRGLKYLAVYGAWELDKVARELAKHGLQIEYFRTSLMPQSLMQGIKDSSDESLPVDPDDDRRSLKLNLIDVTRHLVKLAKLKSLNFSCFEFLADFHQETKVALKDVSDLIWRIDCRVPMTYIVEEVLNQILRRGNQSGRSYLIKLIIEPDDASKARFYMESIQKFSTMSSIKDRLHLLASNECKQRYGRAYKAMSLWGIEQAEGRDKGPFEQLKAAWDCYEEQFRPLDRYV